MSTQTINVAENVCGPQGNCGPKSLEASLGCSPIGWGTDSSTGWVFQDAICSIQFYGPVCSSGQRRLSEWIPNSFQLRFCPIPNQTNTEPNDKQWTSSYTYFGSVSTGTCSNQYRAYANLNPTNSTTIVIDVHVEALTQVAGANTWVNYCSFTATCVEPAGRTKQYENRAYLPTQQYYTVSPSFAGGKGDVQVASITSGLIAWIERCGVPCGMFESNNFKGCATGLIESKTNTFYPQPFTLGRNGAPCGGGTGGTPSEIYCYCDDIILTSLSPITGTTTNNNSDSGGNGFVQEFGVIGATGETVGAIQQLQIGTFTGGTIAIKSIDGGPLQFGSKLTSDTSYTWGATKVQNNNPTVWELDRPTYKIFIYMFEFPNDTIVNCTPPTVIATSTRPIPVRNNKGCGCRSQIYNNWSPKKKET